MVYRSRGSGGYTPDEEHIVITASGYTGGGHPVVWCHGGGDGGDQAEPIAVRRDLHVLANQGYVVCAADLAGTLTWGNDASTDAIDAMLVWLAATYDTDNTQVVLIGDSHGALTAINWAVRNTGSFAAAVLRVPAVALQRLYERDVAGLASTIADAYTDEAGLIAAYPTNDPSHPTFVASIDAARIAWRMGCWYNTGDPIILADEVEDFCAASGVALYDLGGGATHSPWEFVDAKAQARWIRDRVAS